MKTLPHIEAQGCPPTFCDFVKSSLEVCMYRADATAKEYAMEVIKENSQDIEELQKNIQEIEEKRLAMDDFLSLSKKGIFADVRKNGGSA